MFAFKKFFSSCVYWPGDILTSFWFSVIKDQECPPPHRPGEEGQRFWPCILLQFVFPSLQVSVSGVRKESIFHVRTLLVSQHDRQKSWKTTRLEVKS